MADLVAISEAKAGAYKTLRALLVRIAEIERILTFEAVQESMALLRRRAILQAVR